MTFKQLASYFAELEKTSSRNQMTEILAALFKLASVEEIDKICYLSLGRLAPLYEAIEFNLAEKLMFRALARTLGISEEKVKFEYKKTGDLGEVIFKYKVQSTKYKAKKSRLVILEVYEKLKEIALESGKGSVERKINKTAVLLNGLDSQSAKYIVRILLGKLRMGYSDKTILDALSWMLTGDKSHKEEIEAAYNIQTDVGQIAVLIKKEGLKGLRAIKVQLGVPIMPALCQRLPTAEKMIEKMGKVAAEPKYDGTRLQLHFSRVKKEFSEKNPALFDFQLKDFVRTFTRNLENTTPMFPDVTRAAFEEIQADEVIVDGEAIGYDPKSGRFLPFQETIKRKRKYDIKELSEKIPLKYFVFDVLYIDGQDLLRMPFSQRREILTKILSSKNKVIILSPQIITDDANKLRKYHDEQKKKGLEGIVVKKWHSDYDPGKRGYTWVKFKEEVDKKGGGLADTLDCVVMGYNKGRGKRAGFGIGAFLVGVRESENSEEFLTISKIGTGLSDEQWREMIIRSKKYEVRGQPKQYQVDKNLFPDVWIQPGIVVEIQADNITKSPIHTAGLALRFPRLVRFRDLKAPEEATTLAEAKKLYQLQK